MWIKRFFTILYVFAAIFGWLPVGELTLALTDSLAVAILVCVVFVAATLAWLPNIFDWEMK